MNEAPVASHTCTVGLYIGLLPVRRNKANHCWSATSNSLRTTQTAKLAPFGASEAPFNAFESPFLSSCHPFLSSLAPLRFIKRPFFASRNATETSEGAFLG